MIFESALLQSIPGIQHGFGTLSEPYPATLRPLWEASRPFWQQVHKTAHAWVDTGGQQCGEVDALLTSAPQLPIAVVSADCVPILIAAEDGSAIAAVHSGWRGTEARILTHTLTELKSKHPRVQRWIAAIGPAIGPCCYEVSEEIAERFAHDFGGATAVPTHRHLDLQAVNRELLLSAGLAARDIDILRHCTQCSVQEGKPLLHSYRREGGGTRQYSTIVRR